MAESNVKLDREKFKDKSYWEGRYGEEESFDWFCELQSFEHLLFKHLNRSDSILNLGCGNSHLSQSLYLKDYKNITNVDFSEIIIKKMREKTTAMADMKWEVMDMLDLKFGAESFDLVLDKGSIDSLLVDQGSVWNPNPKVIAKVEQALSEACRVLKVGGRFISITFSQPHFRGKLLYQPDKYPWNLHHYRFGDSFHYYFFCAIKMSDRDSVLSEQLFDYSYPSIYTNGTCLFGVLDYIEGDDNFLKDIHI